MNQHTKPAPRNRIVAGLLCLIYVALMGLAFYLHSIRVEDHWPSWALWVAGVAWGAIMLALPFLTLKYYLGLYLLPDRPWRFSLRAMLLGVLFIGVFIWLATQFHWLMQRIAWRDANRTDSRSTQSQAPSIVLWWFGEQGESRLEIKNPTKEQIAEAERLFPEATVVAVPERKRTQGK